LDIAFIVGGVVFIAVAIWERNSTRQMSKAARQTTTKKFRRGQASSFLARSELHLWYLEFWDCSDLP